MISCFFIVIDAWIEAFTNRKELFHNYSMNRAALPELLIEAVAIICYKL